MDILLNCCQNCLIRQKDKCLHASALAGHLEYKLVSNLHNVVCGQLSRGFFSGTVELHCIHIIKHE